MGTGSAVTIGASDPLRTHILTDLNAGDTVVIASVSSAVLTANPSTQFGRGGGGGGRTGGTGAAGPAPGG
jgi:hypothetical protein